MKSVLFSIGRDGAAFYRVKDWPHLLGFILLGYAAAGERARYAPLMAALITGVFYLAHGYSINDICDRQSRIAVSRRQALLLSLAPLVLCLLAAWAISPNIFLVAALGHASGMFYSAPPFRFKNKIFLDLIFNGLALSLLFLLGYMTTRAFDLKAAGFLFLFFLYFIPVQLAHEIQDREADRAAGLRSNTFQTLGMERTVAVMRAACVFYALWALHLWKTGSFGAVSFFLSAAFAAALFFFPPGLMSRTNIKLDVRRVSVGYGVLLWIALLCGV